MESFSPRDLAPDLKLEPEGWWSGAGVSSVSYPEDGNDSCFALEDRSFWFQHRNRCVLEIMGRLPPPGIMVDVGGGNGYVARAIQDAGHEVVLVEPGLSGVRNARNRGIRHVVHADLNNAGFTPGSIPGAGLFDVLEHIPDDLGFLRSIRRMMKPAGRL